MESQELAKHGYHPVNQSWAEGQWGPGAWLVALPLCLVFIGFVLLAYMLIVKPAGTLTVTYTRIEAAAKPTPQPARVGPMPNMDSVRERLARLDELHASGVVTDEEYAARRVKILDELFAGWDAHEVSGPSTSSAPRSRGRSTPFSCR